MKVVGYSYYVHKSNISELPKECQQLVADTKKYLISWVYDVVKVNMSNNKVSYIRSEDWNVADEPRVGASMLVDRDGNAKIISSRGQIYHHKWSFVASDYKGFDIEESKKRSKKWTKVVPKEDKRKIGYKSYWDKICQQYNI